MLTVTRSILYYNTNKYAPPVIETYAAWMAGRIRRMGYEAEQETEVRRAETPERENTQSSGRKKTAK